MKRKRIVNLFDVIAYLCTLFSKEKERECAINWSTADEKDIREAIKKYNNVIERVLNISSDAYVLNTKDIKFFEKVLKDIFVECESGKLDYGQVYLLILHIENSMKEFFDRQGQGVIHKIGPLNSNHEELKIAFYPFYNPVWGQSKSERYRDNTFNAKFLHYFMLREEDMAPFKLVFYYWNDMGIINSTENGWNFRVAMSPVMDNALIKCNKNNNGFGKAVAIEGIENEEEVNARVEHIFDDMMEKAYGIVMFPEVLGNEGIELSVKKKMQKSPEFNAFVLLPTICSEKKNRLIVLGAGGIEVLKKEKATSFILIDENGDAWREQLSYTNRIDLLITRELGIVAFPICAEMLEPKYYSTLIDTAKVDFIVCASFSPGYQAFKEAMRKGDASRIFCLWINTCSAKNVSKNKRVPEILAAVQIPKGGEDSIIEIKPECKFCCAEELCYFDVCIKYEDERFGVEFNHVRL